MFSRKLRVYMLSFTSHSRTGFSLVELSIVLVILGLLVGGILGGQSLIRASELRDIAVQRETFISAINSFKEKYHFLPGDMPNATSFWGAQASQCLNPSANATCNGNGNGSLQGAVSNQYEEHKLWQHLGRAEMLQGQYRGVIGCGAMLPASCETMPLETPLGKLPRSAWSASYDVIGVSGRTEMFDGRYGNMLFFGGTGNTHSTTPILKPEELWNVDTKIDDGKPALGKLVIYAENGLTLCTDGADSTTLTANYLLTSQAKECSAIFRDQF